VKGTIGYIPTEAFQGQVSDATDVYALGVLVLETATGLPAILLPSKEHLSEHVEDTLADLKERKGDPSALLCASPLAASSCDWSFEGGPEALLQLLGIGVACCQRKARRPALRDVVARLERVLADLASRVRECLVCLDAPRAAYLQLCTTPSPARPAPPPCSPSTRRAPCAGLPWRP
jgi:serine/threonine protein kinase